MNAVTITYLQADQQIKYRIEQEWGEKAARHMHLSEGFSIVAFHDDHPVGLIAVYPKKLPFPLSEALDWYIDILEVHQQYRRKGIATQLIKIVCERAKENGVYQVRAWSSEDKIEAMSIWKALGFGLCPAVTYPQGQEVKGYFVAKVS